MNKIVSFRRTDVHGLIEDVAGLAAISVLVLAGLFLPAIT